MNAPYDLGLQPERTELAWRRTALVLGLGSLVALRIFPSALGNPWWAVVGVVGVIVALAVLGYAHARYRDITRRLHLNGYQTPLPDARVLGALTLLAMTLGVIGMVVTLMAA